jgi:hypothetical protein
LRFWRFLRVSALVLGAVGCGPGKGPSARNAAVARPDSPAAVAPSAGAAQSTSTSTSWIGQRFKSIPDSIADYGGDTIVVSDTVFGVRFVGFRSHHALWLVKGMGKGPSGAAEWTIVTAMDLEPVDDERVFLGDCRVRKKADRRIIALGLYDDLPWFTRIHREWRANIGTRSFDEIAVAGVDCKNTDRGE